MKESELFHAYRNLEPQAVIKTSPCAMPKCPNRVPAITPSIFCDTCQEYLTRKLREHT